MKGYIIGDIEVTDRAVFDECRAKVPAMIAAHGGRYVVRGGAYDRLEGDWTPRRLVILEFPSVAQARGFYEAPEYQPLKALRERSSRSNLVIVEGYAP